MNFSPGPKYIFVVRKSFCRIVSFLSLFVFLVFSAVTAQKITDTIHFKAGSFVAHENLSAPEMQKELENGKWGNFTYSLFVFENPPTAGFAERLKKNGVEFLSAVSSNAFQVRFRIAPPVLVLNEAGVKALYAIPAPFKFGAELSTLEQKVQPHQLIEITVLLHKGVVLSEVLPVLNMAGFSLTKNQFSNQGLLIGTI